MNIKKLILVTAKHLPQHKYFETIAKDIANYLKVPLDIIEEDYVFVNTYGEKDEFGMAWLPQLFAQIDEEIKPILTRLPINEKTLDVDLEKAKKDAMLALGITT
ncbi:hypothetical protein QPL79_03425 [Ignisphaera sp. 4213-co]|uniref:Flavodoxin-like domain-containing protein n=1 Tax=Ignisphaera cupida TaxID=3050454 RepID=A0ABD4Z745_9CREN|nr:hypothetical protein [Ignisphaera sp. 4213-co]MDK6028413.1 hypothetical protein [Ignisphaera sp. 4213-co]